MTSAPPATLIPFASDQAVNAASVAIASSRDKSWTKPEIEGIAVE